jgi:hypothetical protein
MKNERKKGFLMGVVTTLLMVSLISSAFAVANITVDDTIKILVNGQAFKPKDVTGKEVKVFAYGGTTYAPVRALAEAYGLVVSYDASRNMATVSRPVASSLTLGAGIYVAGTDVPVGMYDCKAVSGSGNFIVWNGAHTNLKANEIMGITTSAYYISEFRNLTLEAGDTIQVTSSLKLQLVKK